MTFAAVAIGVSSVVGAGASIISGNKASKAQQYASDQATAVQKEQLAEAQREYDQDRTDRTPYREAGYTALGQLGAGTVAGGEFNRDFTMADYEADPGYQFRKEQGLAGIENSAAAHGGVLGGGTLKALARFNSGLASQEYGAAYDRFNTNTTQRFNRLSSIAGTGQTALSQDAAATQANVANQANGANNIANNISAAGNARASQYVNTGQAISNGVNSIGQYFALKDLYKTPAAFVPETGASYAGSYYGG